MSIEPEETSEGRLLVYSTELPPLPIHHEEKMRLRVRMRKTIKRSDTELAPEKGSWLDVSAIARVEVTSEDSHYPIESVFAEGDKGGWRAAERGKQTIRLFFDEPQRIRRCTPLVRAVW
jgi:hypothetical protein